MKINILNAYQSHTGELVAIASDRYYVLKKVLDETKGAELVKKINSVRIIETDHWEERI